MHRLAAVLILVGPALNAGDALLFRASLSEAPRAERAGGQPMPLVAERIRFDRAAVMPPNASLVYDARKNMFAAEGSVSFWWRPDEPVGRVGFPLFLASYEQHGTWDYNFAGIHWDGTQLRARVRNRNLEYLSVSVKASQPQPGRWMHVAMTWSETGGMAFYLDGKPAGRVPGPVLLDARLDQFGFLSRAVTPHHTGPSENAGSVREARVYAIALDESEVARLAAGEDVRIETEGRSRRLPFPSPAEPPSGRSLYVRRVPVLNAKDLGRFWLKGADGKRETLWPTFNHGYQADGKTYRVWPAAEPVNYLRTTGNLEARVSWGGASFDRAGDGEIQYRRLERAVTGGEMVIERRGGVLGDLEFLHVEERTPGAAGGWSRLPLAPAAAETPVGAVRVRIASRPGTVYHVGVRDPVNDARLLIEVEARAAGERLELMLDFPDFLVPAGKALEVELEPAVAAEAQLAVSDAARARREHVAERIAHIRDSFQMLSEARPWMHIGRRTTAPELRRRLKLVDELFTLLEDVRRVDPGNAVANGYWSWINRFERPPAYEEAAPPAGVPLWAHRQLTLLKQFRGVVDWWIDNRQIETGEMGGGLGDDTDMIQNWPGVSLMDGPSDKIRRSVRRVLEACYAQGMVERGMNTHRTDALHAYEEGMNAYGPAFLTDYGNPVIFERMMETASHYPRLTGINGAGHRHFRSILYSATDVVEEGYHAREDMYSHLLYHPGLYVAWYNGSGEVRKLLREVGDSLLDHWKKESYPHLARGIFFADDRVENRAEPNTETFNLLWGLYEIERDPRYLWLLRQAEAAGDMRNAGTVNGPWLDLFEAEGLRRKLEAEAARRSVDDHNLQTDNLGVMARALLRQLTGEAAPLDQAQAALVRHMAQNMYLYTKAEQYTDRIWIPTPAIQRLRLGGVAHIRNHIFPGHAVSWENTGGEVAAVVEKAGRDRLSATLFNAGGAARTITARVWRLDNGRYEITLKSEDGTELLRRTAALKRYAALALPVPSRRPARLEIRQLEAGAPITSLPDLAVAPEEIRDSGGVEVVVHNIGGAASGAYRVVATDASGKTAEARRPGLSAPAGYNPSREVVRLPGVTAGEGLRVEVIPDLAGPEICEENNRAVFSRRASAP